MSEYLEPLEGGAGAVRSNDLGAAVRSVVAAIRRRWWLVVGVFVVVVGITIWRATQQPRLYRSTAVVQLEEARHALTMENQPVQYDWRVDPIQSAQEIIKSQEIAERVARRLGLRLAITRPGRLTRWQLFGETLPQVDSMLTSETFTLVLRDDGYVLQQNGATLNTARYGAPVEGGGVRLTVPSRPRIDARDVGLQVIPLAVAAGGVRGGIVTRNRAQTNIVEISYTGTDPVMVQYVANAAAEAYREFSAEEQRNQARARTRIIQQSVVEQQMRLDSAQAALERFKERQQLSNVAAEQSALTGSIQGFENQRDAVLIERGVYEKVLGRLGATDTSSAELRRLASTPAIEKNQYISGLYSRWFDLLNKREQLLAQGFGSNYVDVRAVDSLIAVTKDNLQEASGLYLSSLQSRLDALDARIESLRSEMGRYPPLEAQEQKLVTDVRMAQNVYESLQADYQRARITQSIDEPTVRIVDAAERASAPISPERRSVLLTGIIIGLMLGLGAAVAVEQFDDTVKMPEEVPERFDLPVLGTIPEIKDVTGLLDEESKSDRLVPHLDPRSPVAEAYRSLRTNLAFARAHEALRTLVLTSPGPADGKSTTVANLAITFAQQGQRTLLVDADLRRAVLDRLFDVPRQPGLTDVLVGQAHLPEVIRETAIANLHVVGSGPFPPNPSELLGSAAMRETLREACELFDIVLLDSPPLLAVTDAAVLSTMVDGAVLVIRMGRTLRTSVRRAIAQLQAVHGRLVGAVLNDVDYRHGAYGAGYGYYYYYYYGHDGHRNGSRGGVLDRVRQWRLLGSGPHRES